MGHPRLDERTDTTRLVRRTRGARKAVVLAAGKGERLVNGMSFPKPMKEVAGVPLIVRILENLDRAGVEEVAVVVGHLGDVIRAGLERYGFDARIRFVENDEFHKPNGTSLLKAKAFIDEPTYLMMADHLWAPELLHAVGNFPIASNEAVLGVDFDIPRCFDLDDATKVRLQGDRIVDIAKELPAYDALDTGVFRITPALIAELERVDGPNGCSLSQGVRALSEKGLMRAANVGHALWIDVDTPEAHAQATRLISMYGDSLRVERDSMPVVAAE